MRFTIIRTALRAAIWKRTLEPGAVRLPGLLGWVVLNLVTAIVDQYVSAGTTWRFSFYGLNAVVAMSALTLAAAGLVMRAEYRMTGLAVMAALSVMVDLVRIALTLLVPDGAWDFLKLGLWSKDDSPTLFFLLHLVWWFGAMLAVVRSLDPDPYRWHTARVAALYLATLVAYVAVPHFPVFRGENFDYRAANYWEYVADILRGGDEEAPVRRVDGARVELAQPALMDEAVARLVPQIRGRTDIYALGVAGWAQQDVFVKELDGALAAIGKTLPVQDRILRLVNHADTAEHTPVASRANFAAAVRSIGRIMDKDEDVLLLFLTSHGSTDGVALVLPGLIRVGLAPEDVAAVLEREGIKNRIIIVSACYSGVFVKPLANDHTVVLTAADEKNPSFGCSNEREWTYFGDAFFNRSLRPGVTIEEAFLDAKVVIGQWEARDDLTPSNPQAHFGEALMAKLAPLYAPTPQAEAEPAVTQR